MNFLSHYIVDHKQGHPYYNCGLILPDIAKGFSKFGKLNQLLFTEDNHKHLQQGSLQHLASDKRFHSSTFFNTYHQAITALVNQAHFSKDVTRKWFIAHIVFELLVDRVMVRSYPEMVHHFYNDLNLVKEENVIDFLKQLGIENETAFLQRFNHFRQVQYIFYYTDNNKFIYSLNRIMMRVGLIELSEFDAAVLLDVILTLEKMYFANPQNVLNELKNVFE